MAMDSMLISESAGNRLRKEQAARKYAEAVRLYADTRLSLQEIAKRCGVTAGGLQAYLRRHHRELILARYDLLAEGVDPRAVCIQPVKGPTPAAYLKYKDAVEACGSTEYIEYSISQVARMFGVDATALNNFMKVHYAHIPLWRKNERIRRGLDTKASRGSSTVEQYARAVELYRTSEYTIPEVAELCGVSPGGLCQHLRFYHKDIIAAREQQRMKSGKRKRGERTRNGRRHEPGPDTERKYAEAVALYRDTAMTLKDIVERTGVSPEGLRSHLHFWHMDLVLERAGIDGEVGEGVDLRRARKRMKTVAAKYAGAIESLRDNPRPLARVAAEYGFNPETFRDYVRKHEPELAGSQGMTVGANGHRVARRCVEKYAEAVRLYAATAEPLKSIAARLGLVYNSVGGYVRRHCPDAIRSHEALVKQQQGKNKQSE